MRTPLCNRLGCDVPVFAFSHCRDVVAAVSKAGGFGVLGASTFSPEQLETELAWIDEHTDGRPYGVDVLTPSTYDAAAEASPTELEGMIPAEHREFLDKLLAEHGVPELDADERDRLRAELGAGRGGMTPGGARRLLDVAMTHHQITFVVSALGIPPADVTADLKARGIVVGAMCGKARPARKQVAAGVDVVIAQGTEAGGHTGEIATMVGSQITAALAMGAQGVWPPTPLQGVLHNEAHARVVRARRGELYSFPAGQSVCAATRPTTVAEVVYKLQEQYGEAMERLIALEAQ